MSIIKTETNSTTGPETWVCLVAILPILSTIMIFILARTPKTAQNLSPNVPQHEKQYIHQPVRLKDATKHMLQEDCVSIITTRADRTDIFICTGFCKNACCCGEYADGITASGYRIKPGDAFVAADKRLPFGTMISIPGYNNGEPVPVRDRGGSIKGNCIDLFFDDDVQAGISGHERALRWGRQYLEVTIYSD